ncbi:MAG: M20 family metallo-hydrolase [Tannerella sp.]|jgi:acetylornithine deacetylase|nr:M20 family metallo-hydrolase [Tannerella sp.]
MEHVYNAIDLLRGMIIRPSFSREESEVANFLQTQWEKEGHKVNREGNNLWMIAPGFDAARPTILLNSHIDTVRPVSGWERDPFSPKGDGDYLFGLGSSDSGASVVSLYQAFVILSAQNQPYNLIYVASAEEEISGEYGVEYVLNYLPPITFGIVGEPTGMHPAIAEKGLMVLDCICHGVSGHAARNEGVNAILLAIQAINSLNDISFPQQSDFLGPVKMTTTMIKAGVQHNVIPDRCEFTVDVRSNEYYSNEKIYTTIKNHLDCEVISRGFRMNSSGIDPNHPFVQRAIMLGKKPYGSPTLSDQSLMHFPTVKIGPGDSARSHTADEYILFSEISEAIELYVRLLDRINLSDFHH